MNIFNSPRGLQPSANSSSYFLHLLLLPTLKLFLRFALHYACFAFLSLTWPYRSCFKYYIFVSQLCSALTTIFLYKWYFEWSLQPQLGQLLSKSFWNFFIMKIKHFLYFFKSFWIMVHQRMSLIFMISRIIFQQVDFNMEFYYECATDFNFIQDCFCNFSCAKIVRGSSHWDHQ